MYDPAGRPLDAVGPVLEAGRVAEAIIAAIRRLNKGVVVVDRGAYLRVQVPARCVVTRAEIERVLAESFRLPRDLEGVMPSFSGQFSVNEDEAVWEAVQR